MEGPPVSNFRVAFRVPRPQKSLSDRYETTVRLQESDPKKYTPNALEFTQAPEEFLKEWAARHSVLRWGEDALPKEWKELQKTIQRAKQPFRWTWEYYADGLPKVPQDLSDIDTKDARDLYSEFLRIHFSTNNFPLC